MKKLLFILLIITISVYAKNDQLKIHKTYYNNGKLKSIVSSKAGKLHGDIKSYYENGQLESETPYKNGTYDGVSIRYYDDGSLKSRFIYENGETEGEGVSFYKNGQLEQKVFHEEGKLEGSHIVFYEDGALRWNKKYKNGNAHGLYLEYNKNGTLKEEASYHNGLLNGVTKHYDSNGKIERENFYQYNTLLYSYLYDENGEKNKIIGKNYVGPSFDCDKAFTKVELAICGNESLALLDRNLSNVYTQLKKDLPQTKFQLLQNTQKAWVKNRDRLSALNKYKIKYLTSLYSDRISFLKSFNDKKSNLLVEYKTYRMDDFEPQWENDRLIFSGYTKNGNNFDIIELDPLTGKENILIRNVKSAKFIAQNENYIVYNGHRASVATPLVVYDKESKSIIKVKKLSDKIIWSEIQNNKLIIAQPTYSPFHFNESIQLTVYNLPSLKSISYKKFGGGDIIKKWKDKYIVLGSSIYIYNKDLKEVNKNEVSFASGSCSRYRELNVFDDRAIVSSRCGEIQVYKLPSLALDYKLDYVRPGFVGGLSITAADNLLFVSPEGKSVNHKPAYDNTDVYVLTSGKKVKTLPIKGSHIFSKDNKIITVIKRFAKEADINVYKYDFHLFNKGGD